jgi:hypothetical protein
LCGRSSELRWRLRKPQARPSPPELRETLDAQRSWLDPF